MLKKATFRFAFYAVLPFLLFFAACSGGNTGGGSEPMTSVGIKLALNEGGATQSKTQRNKVETDSITSLTIKVVSENGNELAPPATSNVTPGTTVTLTLNVPVGANRIFTAEAFDAEGQVILFGNAVTDLQEGVPVNLTIPVEPPLQVSPETPTIDLGQTQAFTAARSPLLSDALQWSVDGIVGGDALMGTITETGDTSAEYTAPLNATVPALAQVVVRAASADNPDLYFDETTALINDPAKTLIVDPEDGTDSDTCGAETDKCKTLTHALSLVEVGGTVLLEPGTYVFGSGTGNETLPLQMKTGVTIHGTTQGGIAFLDFTDPLLTGPGILGADDATLSGMRLESHDLFSRLIDTNGTSPIIQDNLFFGRCELLNDCNSTAIFVDQGSAPDISGNTFGATEDFRLFSEAVHIVDQASPSLTDNTFTGNQVALWIQGDATPRIENNRILENGQGVVIEGNALPDLGGGALGSAGLNILSCNGRVDLFNQTSNTIFAQDNQWDHFPPETFSTPGGGADIVFIGGSVDSSNDTLYVFATCNFGVQVTAPSPNFTTESGGTATFDVVLGTEPSADVVIVLSSSDTSEGVLSNNSLTFTNQNWNTAQTVTVTGQDDNVADGNVFYQIEFDLSGSLDPAYQSEIPAPIDLFNTDDETPGITVSPISNLVTTEAGGTDTFDIVLDSAPTADVTITLNSDDATEGLPSPSALVFTTSNWNTAQTVTLTGQNDNVADGDISYNIVTTVSTSDTVYATIDADDVSVTNNDDGDLAGIRVTPTLGLVTTEAGGTATFDVVLTSEPTANVDISLSSSNTLEGTISANSLTFAALNWNVAQTVTVTGVNDAVADGNVLYSVDIGAASSNDASYSGMPVDDVSVTNNDDDGVGITLSRTAGLITDEGGASDTFTVVLNSQPTASVSIGLSSSDTTEGDVSTTSLSFDASNWNSPQTVTVTGANDDIVDGDVSYTIVTAAASSADTAYSGFDAADVSVSNTDDDTRAIVVSPITGLVTTEAGGSATFTVVLGSEPAADVSIGLSSSDGTEGNVSPPSLTFTSSNWNTAQTVTVTGLNDAVDDGDQTYTIDTTASSTDTAYNVIDPDNVSVSNTDDDTARITLSKTTVVTDESPTSDSFTLILGSEPTANVTITLTSGDPSEGVLSSPSVVFSAGNWNVAQTVTVTGVNDDVADGNQSYTIATAAASSGDPIYSGVDPSDVTATNNDNDVVGITVTPTSGLVTTEAGGVATFDVVLTSEPTAAVSIPLSSSNVLEGTISTSSLSFDASNWNVPQTVTVTGIDDAVADGPVSYTIVTGAASGGDYANFDAADVLVTNNDDDIPGITVNPTAGLVTTEAGGTANFSVVLNTQPTADVVIGLTSSILTEGSLSTSSLTFTNGNWNTAQTVTVTGLDDAVADGDIAYNIVTADAVSADTTGYSGMNVDDVGVTNTDDDIAGITLSRTAGLTTDEDGASDTFTVVLNSEPTASVSIGLSSSDTTEGDVSTTSLSFDASNWNSPQTVTVTGVNDDVVDGNIAYEVITAAASSGDANYNGLNAPNVAVSNSDNDNVGIIVTPTSLSTSEAGGSDSFTIRLNSEPTGDVSIGLSSSDLSEGTVSPASLTFTAGNWNTAQTVTVTGVNDDVNDGDIPYEIVTAAAVSSDVGYSGIDADNVAVSNTDDDMAGVSVVPTSGLVTTESGGNATFTMALTSEPTADVTIALSSNNTAEGTVSPGSLTFTSSNWNAVQTVTVTGVNDFVVDGDVIYTIETAPAASTDGNYSDLNVSDVTVTNRDNDFANIIVNPMLGLETTEAGGTDTFTVVLDTLPSANVTVRLLSSDTSEGTVFPVSLTFTPSDWNSARTVTVTGVNDGIADGDESYNIITVAAVSTDTDYNNLNPSDVSVTNLDDDFRLTVNVIGGGSVTLLPGTINCGTSCIADFPSQTTVTLRTAISSGWNFDSWSGDCSGTSSLTMIVMDTDKNCTANLRLSTILMADFQQDAANQAPNVNLPGDPVGDRLLLNESAGTIRVQQIVLGNQVLKSVVFNQEEGATGGLDLSAFVAGTAPRSGRYLVLWRSSASTRNLSFATMVIRDSSSRILMNISYRPGGILDLNDQNPNGIGIPWTGPFQLFEVTVNLDTQSIDDIVIDGKPIQQSFPIPFRNTNASDLSRLSLEAGGTSAQSLGLDDLVITLLQ